MREIKFRAWQKAYITQFTINDKLTDCNIPAEMIYYFNTVSHGETNFFNFSFVNKDRYELMQFTDLHDKNGKEIYEGDIVRIITAVNEYYDEEGDLIEDENEKIAFISFDDGTFVAKNSSGEICQWNDGTHDWYSLENAIILEVIGNIYENPELIKEVK